MPLTPQAIYRDFINGDLDKPFATELLITLIDNAENFETRIESIDVLNKLQVNDDKTFDFLEHLLISDLNEDIRNLTISVLRDRYLDRALEPMIWAIEHENSLKCLISIILTVGQIDNHDAREVLIKKLKKFSKNEEKHILLNNSEKLTIENLPNRELADILINYYVISFLKTTFGYFRFKRNELWKITELDLSNVERYSSGLNKLEYFLEPIFSLKALTSCDLRFNHLTTIPDCFNNSIEYLDLSYNKLIKLPTLSKYRNIINLNLKSNRLRTLPESIGSPLTLEYLNLRNNMLKALPKSISLLTSLKILDLHGNKLDSIKFDLSKSIKELELGWNNFKAVPQGIKSLLSLERLGLGGNKLLELPTWIGDFKFLKQLDLYDNKLNEIPESIGNLGSLQNLNLRNNQLSVLPSSLQNLKSIISLNLSWNNFSTLPNWIGSLSLLEELNLWGNRLTALPKSIALLPSLKVLDLNFNQFNEIPPFLKELEKSKGLIIKL